MEIVINDTNILIDLDNIGLLELCKYLPLDFRTVDFVMNEITDEHQKARIQDYADAGYLKVEETDGHGVAEIYKLFIKYKTTTNMSRTDCAVMYYAETFKCRLLTGDKKLRTQCEARKIKVSGDLYLTDMLIEEKVVEPKEMIEFLTKLLETNSRAPKEMIRQRITKYKKIIGE